MLICFTNIFKNIISIQGFVPIFTFFMGLISGCLLGIELIPRNIRFMSYLMPAYFANDAITKVILYKYGFKSIIFDSIILLTASGSIFGFTCILNIKEKTR